jgi:hypothetical protein
MDTSPKPWYLRFRDGLPPLLSDCTYALLLMAMFVILGMSLAFLLCDLRPTHEQAPLVPAPQGMLQQQLDRLEQRVRMLEQR